MKGSKGTEERGEAARNTKKKKINTENRFGCMGMGHGRFVGWLLCRVLPLVPPVPRQGNPR